MKPLSLTLLCLFFSVLSTITAQENLQRYSLAELDSLHELTRKPQDKLPYALAMLEKGKKELDINDTAYAKILVKIGVDYVLISNIEQAYPFLQQAIDIQKIKSPKHIDYALCLSALGTIYHRKGQLEKVEPLWIQTSNIRKEILGEKHPSYANSLNNLGNLYGDMGDYPKAESFFLQLLAIQKEVLGESDPSYTNSLINFGILLKNTGDYENAEVYYLKALNILTENGGEKHPNYVPNLINLGVLYFSMREYEKAEAFYLKALTITKDVFGVENPYYAKTLNNLGIVYSEMGDATKAVTFYLKALNIKKEVLGEKDPSYTQSLTNLGVICFERKDYVNAEAYYLQALNIQKEVLGKRHPFSANNYHNLGFLYYNMGDYAKAESYYLQALDVRKETLGEKHDDYNLTLNNLGRLYMMNNQLNNSWQCLLAAIKSTSGLEMSQNINQNWVDSLAKANYVSFNNMNNNLINIHDLLLQENAPSSKIKQGLICDLALTLLQLNRNEMGDESDKLRILAQSSNWVLRAIKIIDKEKDLSKALNLVEQNKSVLLLDANSNKRAYVAGLLPDSLIKQEKQLQKQYANTKAALAEQRTPAEQDEIQSSLIKLTIAIDNFKKETAKNYPKYAAMKYQHESIKTDKIQALLDDKTAILEYLVGDSSVYVFYIDKKTLNVQEYIISNEDLYSRINKMHGVLSNYALIGKDNNGTYQKYTENGWWFYKNLVAPALLNAKGIERLIIIPDDNLGVLPFETFLVKQAPQETTPYKNLDYLINHYKISYNYSTTLWSENRLANHDKNNPNVAIRKAGQIMGMAANYETLLDSLVERLPADQRLRKTLMPLSAARKEVEDLAQNFQGFFAFDDLASERIFKEKAPEFAVIHLAMHGLLNDKEQMLSSLAFTEDSDSNQNNFLHAYEISKMDLNADLVVLSACETGYGKFEKGNGIASLARAFMYAGAPALIVSLWQVNDYATSEIMKNLYNNLADGMKKDEALQQAKLQFTKSAEGIFAHPAFWSSFILIGNESPISISRKNDQLPWLIGGGIILLLGLGGFMMRRKNRLK